MNFSFLFHSCNVQVFSFFRPTKVMFLLNILKNVPNLFYNGKIETELDLFFLWFTNGYRLINANVGGIKDILTHDLAFEFCRNQNKGINTLTENHINYDQIHHIKNNWPGLIFFSLLESHTYGLLVLLYLGLQGVTEFDTDPKGKVTLSKDKVLYVYVPSGYNTKKHLTRWLFPLKDYKITCKIEVRDMKRKEYWETLIGLW